MSGVLVALALAAAAPEPCHTVHGRMDLWNGTPTVRIWVIGAHRELGVTNGDKGIGALPASIGRIWTGRDVDADWRTAIYGDFKVCPEGPARLGHMQNVTVIEAGHLRQQPRAP